MNSPQRWRIAYLVSKYPDFSHTFILREVLALRARGLDIDVASINNSPAADKMTQQERDEAARTFYVKQAGASAALAAAAWMLMRRPLGLFRGLRATLVLGRVDLPRTLLHLFYFLEALILARWLDRRSLTHLHVHFATPASTVALILTHIAPVTLSITVHGPDEFYDVNHYSLAEKIAASSFLVCISFFAQSQLMKLTPEAHWGKFDLARLGVDSAHFPARPFRASPDPLRILCVGRLVATKGQRIVLEAVERLLRDGRRLQLTFVGDGPTRHDLEAFVRERNLAAAVHFAGIVNQDSIQSFYRDADLFVLASFAEGIPIVLMEAMAMEIPCIATCINGIPELIRNEVDGLLVPPSDVAGLAAVIARLADQPALRESLGQAGRLRVQQHYDLDRSADRLREVFRTRLEPARPEPTQPDPTQPDPSRPQPPARPEQPAGQEPAA
jgi:colanic acid/amylovoran biosynthesis glycosyltransferase